MYAVRFSGIELPMQTAQEAWHAAGSDSGFPTSEERRANRAAKLAELRFCREKGYPLPTLSARLMALLGR